MDTIQEIDEEEEDVEDQPSASKCQSTKTRRTGPLFNGEDQD